MPQDKPVKNEDAEHAPSDEVSSETKSSKEGRGTRAVSEEKSAVSSDDVNLGHVFALRPRVPTSFKQVHFRTARQQLRGEAYESVEEAARAVAEKALEITHDGSQRTLGGKRRKWS